MFPWFTESYWWTGLRAYAKEQLDKLSLALNDAEETLPYGGVYHWRVNGEYHHMNPRTITALQRACREGNYEHFKNYSALLDGNGRSLRHLLEFKQRPSVPLEEVEAVENILKRFATGAMSFGSISHEAHSTLAVAMNRIGLNRTQVKAVKTRFALAPRRTAIAKTVRLSRLPLADSGDDQLPRERC